MVDCLYPKDLFYCLGLSSIPTGISNDIHYKVWDEVTYPFRKRSGATVEVWEWIITFIPCFTGLVIIYPRFHLS